MELATCKQKSKQKGGRPFGTTALGNHVVPKESASILTFSRACIPLPSGTNTFPSHAPVEAKFAIVLPADFGFLCIAIWAAFFSYLQFVIIHRGKEVLQFFSG